ncbi:S1 family peptidase [Thiothrix fructosivorans]|uniref:Trypsin-like peptidase domain-containing protein n=1 Tax=Thiothrix fructosivorans TaxID=111770 RepID=A0A8B0SL42_9GAMM|nr:serine protease [Thiothrix fructosivorans]MBO0611897.1 trypsin-like peptidase domain-containing protein [Thiothrix fructosivorans]QTX10457.1 trypsin-like peptidase domain-containing protein [Thiothrix fructosivorans]
MLNADWLVQVYAHHKDDYPCIGTGYSIGNGLVLTARHVVVFDERAADPRLRLLWPEQNKHEMPFADADIMFDGFACEPNIDVAVIRCPQATPFKPPQIDWLLTDLVPTTAWAGRGFPRAAKEPTIRDDLGMSGTVAGLKKHVVELATDVDAIEANGWAGFSGSPVFIGQQLAAVITHDYSSLEGYFKAVSIPWLLHNEELFREIVKPAKQVTAQLHAKVKAEATRILDGQAVLREKLKVALKLDSGAMATGIAAYLVEKQEVGQAIGVLAQISLELDKKKPESLKERWEDYLTDVEQLCGWLLINSVDPDWWLKHEASLQSIAQDSVTRSLSLDTQAYVEVIISRSLLQQARYDLDEYGDPIPASSIHDPMVFDGHTAGASDIQILSEIFKQLRRVDSAPQDVDRLLADIQKTARALSKRQDSKPIYYIVSNTYLEMLKDLACYPKLKEKLAGCVQFICCVQTSLDELSPCREDQSSLLEDLAVILRLKNPKRVAAHV